MRKYLPTLIVYAIVALVLFDGKERRLYLLQLVISATVAIVLYLLLEYVSKRPSKKPEESDDKYIVRLPAELKNVYGIWICLGIVMLTIFGCFRIRNAPGVSNGIIWLSVLIMAVGVLIAIMACRWKIIVQGNQLEVRRLFHRRLHLFFPELEKAKEQTKTTRLGVSSKIVLYKDGKKLITVSYLSNNYDRLSKTLKAYGKLP